MVDPSVNPIPAGYSTVTPGLCLADTARAIEFYVAAFGAQERSRMLGPNGSIMHAEIEIGSSIVMLADEMPGMSASVQTIGSSPVAFYLYVTDVDAAYAKAISAGATEVMPVADQFWGDRMGQVMDPFGYRWSLASRVKVLTPEQMREAGEAFMARAAGASEPSRG